MKAVVMAGGEGSRLRPLTINRPKPLVPVCNVPIMQHVITLLKRHNVTDLVCTVHYLADEIQAYFGDGSEFDVNIAYSVEDSPLGTAGSVKKAEALLKDGTFIIASGDALTDCDLSSALAAHKHRKAAATLILARVSNPLDFGVVISSADGLIERFVEKPSWSEVFSDTVNTGMYILEPEVLDLMEPNQTYDWSQDVFPEMLRKGMRVYGHVMDGYWCDIGSLSQYREAQEHLMSGQVDLPPSGTQIAPGVVAGVNTLVDDDAEIVPPVCLGRNCKVKRGARIGPYAALNDNTMVDEGAVVERSVVWEGAYIGAGSHIRSAIIGSRATIKMDSVVHEDAVVGDRCLVDVGCVIRPRVKLWPDKLIERGSTVTMSLVWGNRWRGQLFRELGVAGLSNIEITPDFATRLGSAYGSCLPALSKIVVGRDSSRSSRMIKRAIIAALLSVGCDVLDLHSAAVPVGRHFIKTCGAQGAIHIRKLPGNNRVTLIEMFDNRGSYLARSVERKVESAFFREDFNRADPDDLGVIETAHQAIEAYQAEFLAQVGGACGRRRIRVVCDYGYSALSSYLPVMLARLGVESISLNGYNDAKLAPRSDEDIAHHEGNLRQIVRSLNCEMGVLFTNEGERLTVVNSHGEALSGNTLFAALGLLLAKAQSEPMVSMSVTAPSRLEAFLGSSGVKVIRTKADVRSLVTVSLDAGVSIAGDGRGGFIFPGFHPGFDGAFAFAKLIGWLFQTGARLDDLVADMPSFRVAYEQVRCPWEAKGSVMRRITEERHEGAQIELVDGVRIIDQNSWVLVLPDAVEPMFHVYAESPEDTDCDALAGSYVRKIERMQQMGVVD